METVNVAPGGKIITSLGGIHTRPDGSLEGVNAEEFHALVICGGTLALARAGILDDERHTSNDLHFLTSNAPGYAGQSLFVDEPAAVMDQRVITAAGNVPIHFSAAVFLAVGVEHNTVDEFLAVLAKEHGK